MSRDERGRPSPRRRRVPGRDGRAVPGSRAARAGRTVPRPRATRVHEQLRRRLVEVARAGGDLGQFVEKVSAPGICRPTATRRSWPTRRAMSTLVTTHSTRAGRSWRARRTRLRQRDLPVRWCSRTSRVVMRKPETTKKTSTPRKPPGQPGGVEVVDEHPVMARARSPSRPSMRPGPRTPRSRAGPRGRVGGLAGASRPRNRRRRHVAPSVGRVVGVTAAPGVSIGNAVGLDITAPRGIPCRGWTTTMDGGACG